MDFHVELLLWKFTWKSKFFVMGYKYVKFFKNSTWVKHGAKTEPPNS